MKKVPFTDQRELADDEFLDGLRLPGAAGKRLGVARKRGERVEIVRAVAGHFRTRRGPRWPFYMHGSAWLEQNGRGDVLEKAEGLLLNRFRSSWPPFDVKDLSGEGGEPAWGESGGDAFGRNTFVPELTTAFALTGRTAYIEKVRDLVRSYVEHRPFVLHEGFDEDHDRFFGTHGNGTLTVAYRCLRWIDMMHSGALHVPGVFSDEDVFWLVKQLWFYSMQYYRFVGDRMRRDNHHLVDHGHMPFASGVMFPEFSVSRDLLQLGRKAIRHHFGRNIFADGGYAEHSTKYQYHITYHYLNPQAIAEANGVRLLSAREKLRLRKWVEFSARACKPDGVLAEFGDEYGGELAFFFDTLASPVMTPRLRALARALGYGPGDLRSETPASLARRFRRWRPGTAPRIGLSSWYERERPRPRPSARDLPRPASIQYPSGGYTFFRSEWGPEADFLAVSHYTDSLPHCHAHWDMMSFVLHTGGETLIGDPATNLYSSRRRRRGEGAQEARGYIYSVDAHNCLVLDDDTLKPIKAMGHRCFWGGYPPKHGLGIFRAGGDIEVAEMWHDAYRPTRHRRFVARVARAGFALVDILTRRPRGMRPHQYTQMLHFEGGVSIAPESPEPGAALACAKGAAVCHVVPGAEADSCWAARRDERLEGVYGVEDVEGGPWIADLTRCNQGDVVLATFMLTGGAAGIDPPPAARYLGGSPARNGYHQHDAVAANAVELAGGGRLLLAACPFGKPLESEELSTDGELAVAVLDRRGSVKAWCLVRGSRLDVGGHRLVRGGNAEWRASWRR